MEQLALCICTGRHDRGGAERLSPRARSSGRLLRFAVLDILPTLDYWERNEPAHTREDLSLDFLAQPFPLRRP